MNKENPIDSELEEMLDSSSDDSLYFEKCPPKKRHVKAKTKSKSKKRLDDSDAEGYSFEPVLHDKRVKINHTDLS